MNIAMTGATGYIGKHLSNYLTEKGGHRIIPLGRSMFREGMSGYLIQTLTHCDVVINLAGAPINKRWTPEYKQELFNSRIVVTNRIIRALNAVKTKPKLMISASAVGYYPSEAEVDEYTRTRGEGFSVRSLLCVGKRGETLSRTYKARYYTLRRSAFSGRGSDAADASPFASHQDSHRHRSRYTGFSVDIDTGSLPCNGVLYHSRRDTWGYITWLLRSRSRNMLSPVRWERLIGHGQRW